MHIQILPYLLKRLKLHVSFLGLWNTNLFNDFSKTNVKDCHGKQVPFYTDVPKILQKLKADGIKIGVASRYLFCVISNY